MFGVVEGGVMRLSPLGEVAAAEWARTVEARGGVVPDVSVVMPNHVHLLFGIVGDDHPAPPSQDATPSRNALPAQDTASRVPTTNPGIDVGRRFGGVDAASVSSIVGGYKSAVIPVR